MYRRHFTTALPLFVLAAATRSVRAQGLAGISDLDATRGLKSALEMGAQAAVRLLGRPDGFLANPKVHIPLPPALQKITGLLQTFGMSRHLEDLERSMNRAAESAVPMGKQLLVDAATNIIVSDAKRILTGGETSVTDFFAERTRTPLTGTFLPVVHRATSEVGLVDKYDRLSRKAQDMGVYHPDDPTIDHYVTRKALDGVYLMIGEEERKIRRDPVGTGSALLGKVFGALR